MPKKQKKRKWNIIVRKKTDFHIPKSHLSAYFCDIRVFVFFFVFLIYQIHEHNWLIRKCWCYLLKRQFCNFKYYNYECHACALNRTYQKFGEYRIQLFFRRHGLCRGHRLQCQGSGIIHHTIRYLRRLIFLQSKHANHEF